MFRLIEFIIESDVNQALALAGIVSLILSIVLGYYYMRSKHLVNEMWTVDTYRANELRRMCSDGFDAIVEVEGNITCDQPLTSMLAKVSCCWYHTTVERQIRSGKNYVWKTDFDEVHSTIFKVNDNTGYTLVDPDKADIDSMKVAERETSRFEALSIYSGVGHSDTGRYRITEEVLLNGGYVYILGQASCTQKGTSSDALMHYPAQGYTDPAKIHYIISRKSEKELTSMNGITTSVTVYMSAIAFAIALFCGLGLAGVIPIISQ
ncbi:MAG: GIDE domain-containing protein [Armatimonadota bacterium]